MRYPFTAQDWHDYYAAWKQSQEAADQWLEQRFHAPRKKRWWHRWSM